MRRFTSIAMFVLFMATFVVAFVEGRVHPGHAELHVMIAVAFFAATAVHVVLNRKAFARQLISRKSRRDERQGG